MAKATSRKRSTTRQPKQTASASLGAPRANPEIDNAIEELVDAQTERMQWGRVEIERRATLHALLKADGFGPKKGYKVGIHEAWIETSDEKAKARYKPESAEAEEQAAAT